MDTPESIARKALARLLRATEKAERELQALAGALRRAEGADFPAEHYEEAERALALVRAFTDEEGRRLRDKILQAGGLEPGRIRRS